MASEQSQRPQTLRYQSNTTFLIGPNAAVLGGAALPGQLQRNSQTAITTTPGGGRAWPQQALGSEAPVAAVEATEVLQVGSNTVIGPPPQPMTGYASPVVRRSQMTASLTEVSTVPGQSAVSVSAPPNFIGSAGSVSAVPPSPLMSRPPPHGLMRRPNMLTSPNDVYRFGRPAAQPLSAGSARSMTPPPPRHPYFASSVTETPGSVAISSVIGSTRPSTNSLGSMSPGLRSPGFPPQRMMTSPGQPRPLPPGRQFHGPLFPDSEIRRQPVSTVDFREEDRIDEGYDAHSGERTPPVPPSRQPATAGSRSGRRLPVGPSRLPPAPGSRTSSGPSVARLRMFQVERDFDGPPLSTRERQDRQWDENRDIPPPAPPLMRRRSFEDTTLHDDLAGPRPRVCNCPGTVLVRRGPPSRSTSGRLRGAYVRDADEDMDDLFMIKKAKKKKKKKQPPPPPQPVAPPPGGFMGFLSGLVGGHQPPPPPPPQQTAMITSDTDSDDESEYELRRFDRRQLENFVRKIDLKHTMEENEEDKEGSKAKAKARQEKKAVKKEEKKPEEKKVEEKKPEEKKVEEKKPEEKAEAKKPEDKPAEKKPEDKPADDKKPEDKPADVKKPEDKPADDKKPEDKPADDKKPEDKPAEKKPEDKPADDKKPEDKPADDKKPEDKPADDKKPEEKAAENAPPTKPTPPPPSTPMDGPLDVKVPVVFVFGGPGSGKGTQCEKIAAKYGFTHISSGDLLRAEVDSGSDRGKEMNDIMKKGELVPIATVLQLLKEAIKKDLPTAKGFLIDGYPRNTEQGDRFEAEVCKVTHLLYFEVKDDTMKQRLLKRGQTSGRVDDNEETIVKRIKTFHDESEPVVEKYKSIVQTVSAEDDPDKVFEAVTAFFDGITKPK